MKPVIKIIVVCLVLTIIFAACGQPQSASTQGAAPAQSTAESTVASSTKPADAPKEPVKLYYWAGKPPESGPQNWVDEFNATHDDIQVEYVRFVNDDAGNLKLDTALMAGEGVDIFASMARDRFVQRVRNGCVEDLTDLVAKYYPDYETDVGVNANLSKVDGKYYGIVNTNGIRAFTLNKTMFEEAGVPLPTGFWTVDEFRETAKKLTHGEGDDKVYGAFLFDADFDKWIKFAATKLGDDYLWKSDGTSNFDAPEIKQSLQLYYDMSLVDGSMPTLAETKSKKLQPNVMFLTGKAAMTDAWWILRYIKDTDTYPHDFVTVFAPIPVMEDGIEVCSAGSGDILSINARCEEKEAAMQLIAWHQKQGVLHMAEFGSIPMSQSIDADAIAGIMLKGKEHLFDLQSYKDYFLGNKVNKYSLILDDRALPELTKLIIDEGEKALIQGCTVDEAIANMKKYGDEALAKAN